MLILCISVFGWFTGELVQGCAQFITCFMKAPFILEFGAVLMPAATPLKLLFAMPRVRYHRHGTLRHRRIRQYGYILPRNALH
ncbi:hypothetical protein LA535_001515 [Salmonella enterica]|uniref:Uncharacterized protein n=2 Tax=Salmonella enterica TaxID=28901 RepID=A0A5T8BHW7_SALER|nr:hypothetical protein [Salmonella enterica subsp. enterica serovar Pensacola]EAQ4576399.1 hypothetical protein [Salmonella enterica]EDQ0314958.1 hypothetical protein [Salmonella enterica subsp. enterica serovar Berta]EDV7396658.1 hypothetical protein [Salmonella enterica subsp. enterica]EEE2520685.1 hypothetical protein [Salmonella enterica subsp. enterica serovar Hato]